MSVTTAPTAPATNGVSWGAALGRVIALVVVIGVPAALGTLAREPSVRSLTRELFFYSPDRFARGAVWTLPLSGVLPPRLDQVGLNTIVMTTIFVPYVLVRGVWKAIGRFFAGHLVATLTIGLVVLPAAALGTHWGTTVAAARDYGISAGLAGVAGAMSVVVWRRAGPGPGLVVLTALTGFFLYRFAVHHGLDYRLAEVEHLLAATVGAALEARLR
jgi:hypothetical protein